MSLAISLAVKQNRNMSQKNDPEIPIGERRLVVRPRTFSVLRDLAAQRETTPTDEMNRAVREMLEREGMWPPRNEPEPSNA